MRKFVLTLTFFFIGLYAVLHLILGSSPVQRRVVAELQAVLTDFGIVLQMESIEFSAFSPKIYLNRVHLETTPKAKFQLTEPLTVDKIKIRFRPIALIFGRIVIDELILFHPRIQVPRADKLYKTAMGLFGSKGAIEVQRPSFDVVFYKMGVVDAFFNIESADPKFAVRSRSLTVIVQKRSGQQRSVVVQTDNLEGSWGKLGMALTKIDIDADLGADSIRLNRGTIEHAEASVNILGVARLPTGNEVVPRSLNASFDVRTRLSFLETFKELGLPKMEGEVSTSGTIKKEGDLFSGKGQVSYEGLVIDGNPVGEGGFNFGLDKRKVLLSALGLKYSGGEFRSPKLEISLGDKYPIHGDLNYTGLRLEQILHGVGLEDATARMETSGLIKVSGNLMPLELRAQMDSKISHLHVLDDSSRPSEPSNMLAVFGDGSFRGPITFTADKMDFDAEATMLGGQVKTSGFISFNKGERSRVKVAAEKASLTQLERIGSLEVGGMARLQADVEVEGTEYKIWGGFDVENARIASVVLGTVGGQAHYQGDLLTFENIDIPSLDPIRGNGYVDFREKGVKYKFYVNARRAETDQVFTAMKGLKLQFEIPTEGEINSRMTIEGDSESDGVQVSASGTAKNFKWFDEKWVSAAFSLTYKDHVLELPKVLLTKPSGALEVRGRFDRKQARLALATYGLEISHFERFGKAPISGEVAGQILFEGDRGKLFSRGWGELKVVKTRFRGVPIPDAKVSVKPKDESLLYDFALGGERMHGTYVRSPSGKEDSLKLKFSEYDFAPVLTLYLSRDIPPLSDLRATGEVEMVGDFEDIGSFKGAGSLEALEVGFKGTPMRIHKPAKIHMERSGIRIDSVYLEGEDSQLAVGLNFEPNRRVDAQLDGRIDLQYLQPFVPGLDYGSGKVTVGLRVSGPPSSYQLLGNLALEGGAFRLSGFSDEFRAVEARLSFSQDRINVDRFEANINGGGLTVEGDVRLDRFKTLAPNLRLHADRVVMHLGENLGGKISGDFAIRGKNRPYLVSGRCDLIEGTLSSFSWQSSSVLPDRYVAPLFTFDVQCSGSEKLMVATEIMQAEFRGNFHLVGDNVNVGLLGTADAIRGNLLFRDTRFNLETAAVKFESPTDIVPRFRVAGRATVREITDSNSEQLKGIQQVQDYEVNLQVSGIPSDYKLRLSSTPPLLEGEIISLLVLGVSKKGQGGGNYLDLGSALVGQIPLQAKLKNELGVNIKLSNQSQTSLQQGANLTPGNQGNDINAPTVRIQKEITGTTKLSYSNTLETVPVREFRLEQMLDENITLNATTMDRSRGSQAPTTQAYGLDFRYRFSFE
ncbi:translocation/assembly module TamB [bacterium]|nr:translocation/assembly module TamB [bacterium]